MATDVIAVPSENMLLERALDLFGRSGYEATTMRDIASAAGIPQLDLYAAFPSKEALLWELAQRAVDGILAGQTAALSDGDDVVESLRRFVRFHADWHAVNGRLARVINHNMESLTEDHRREFFARRALYERTFRRLLDIGNRGGFFDIPNLRVTTYAILQMGIEISVWYRPGGELTADDLASLHEELALRMVGYC
jgi:AcrR family transcriptional regulator